MLLVGVVGASHAMGQAETIDTDGDGMVSYTELLMALPEITEAEFQALDADADGLLSPEELTVAEEAGLITPG
jgi:Ca2+-binding EF-hand superfamily protein